MYMRGPQEDTVLVLSAIVYALRGILRDEARVPVRLGDAGLVSRRRDRR